MPRQDNGNILSDALAGVQSLPSRSNPGGNNPWIISYAATPANSIGGGFSNGLNQNAVPVLLGFGEQANAVSPQPDLVTPQPVEFIDGLPFQITLSGTIQPNRFGKTFKLYLYLVQGSFTPGNAAYYGAPIQLGLFLVTLPLQSSLCAFSNYFLNIDCMWDAQSLQLVGSYQGNVAGNLIAATSFSQSNCRAPLFGLGVNMASIQVSSVPDIVTLSKFYAVGNINLTPSATAAS